MYVVPLPPPWLLGGRSRMMGVTRVPGFGVCAWAGRFVFILLVSILFDICFRTFLDVSSEAACKDSSENNMNHEAHNFKSRFSDMCWMEMGIGLQCGHRVDSRLDNEPEIRCRLYDLLVWCAGKTSCCVLAAPHTHVFRGTPWLMQSPRRLDHCYLFSYTAMGEWNTCESSFSQW